MPILRGVQKRHFRISEYCMQVIADLLVLHPVEVHSVVSFYSFFNEQPQGEFVIRLCRTISCEMFGKEQVARHLQLPQRLAVRMIDAHGVPLVRSG